jgi:hypothetical protein
MGQYDVKGEENEIRDVLAGHKRLDDVMRTVDEVAASDDLAGLFLQFVTAPEPTPPEPAPAAPTGSGLYPDDVSYLDEALHAAFVDPTGPPSNQGVAWRQDTAFGTAELVPPPDLAQRLEVLPQSYLADRRVTEKLLLATTPARGQERLDEALRDESDSTWPDAHYLSPLHPVLDWASDRALASLGRNEVFAVRGDVEQPTVLLLGTLTNRRGQVVAAAWLTAAFPDPDDPNFVLVSPHESAAAALASLGWNHGRANPGPVGGVERLQRLIEPAVSRAQTQMRGVFAAAAANVSQRVQAWSRRLDDWDKRAGELAQRGELRQRRVGVRQERELIEAMNPDRQLVRSLLVVVPETGGAA